MPDFHDLFIRSRGKPIDFEGKQVHVSVRRPVAAADNLRIRFLETVESPLQGLRLTARNATLEIAGQQGEQFVLWADTMPEMVTVKVSKASRTAEVSFRNVWRDEKHGSTMQGLNNAGMEFRDDSDGSLRLMCSDGHGPANFSDLVVDVFHETGSR